MMKRDIAHRKPAVAVSWLALAIALVKLVTVALAFAQHH